MTKGKEDLFDGTEGLDKKSVSFLVKALQENNLPGFDYLEFKQALRALQKMDMDKDIAIRSAYTTGNTMGLTKAKLISSAEHYKQVLDKEKKQFDNALHKQLEQRVHGKKSEKETLIAKISAYEVKISELQKEITKIKDKLSKADAQISEAQAKIDDTKNKFEATYQSFISEISTDIKTLKEIL